MKSVCEGDLYDRIPKTTKQQTHASESSALLFWCSTLPTSLPLVFGSFVNALFLWLLLRHDGFDGWHWIGLRTVHVFILLQLNLIPYVVKFFPIFPSNFNYINYFLIFNLIFLKYFILNETRFIKKFNQTPTNSISISFLNVDVFFVWSKRHRLWQFGYLLYEWIMLYVYSVGWK